MACGCVLLAFDQGAEENRALGFVDMHNIVLYRDIPQLREKLAQLRENTLLAGEISRNGQTLVEERFTFHALGKAIVDAMQAPLRSMPAISWVDRLRSRLGW
ncbi:hypothetical protein ALQ30_200162 [Pseudomonas syringae pv. persicae]|nr:hypothetical protein ALQ30_200162 [Pseudomonas syringae pv. persicae]